jgi:hypothetical protein
MFKVFGAYSILIVSDKATGGGHYGHFKKD